MYHQHMHSCVNPNVTMHSVKPLSCNKRSCSTESYRAINFDGICSFRIVISSKIKENLPKFNGEKFELANNHLKEFNNLMDDSKFDPKDVIMRLFVQPLKGDARDWFSYLLECSIYSWEEFKVVFMEQLGERINDSSVLNEFMSIEKEEDLLVQTFTKDSLKH